MARRLNTRFLTILLLVVAGVGVALFLAERFLIHEHPDRYIELGRQAIKDHRWQDAVFNFSKASALAPRDPDIQMMLGQAYEQVIQLDPNAIRSEVQAYQKALEIDPKYLPALNALSALFTREAARDPTADLFSNAIDYTKRAHDVDPDNEKLQSLYDKLIIEQWVNGLSTDQKAVNQAVKEMRDLWKKNPSDADLPYAIASSEIEEGMTIASQNPGQTDQSKEITDHYKNAATTFDAAFAGPNGGPQGQNAAMHYAFARVLSQLSTVDQSSPDVLKTDQAQASTEIEAARKLVKPGDPQYEEISEFAASQAMRRGDRAAAIAIYKSMPPTPMVQISLADALMRSRDSQDDAVTVLKNALGALSDDPNHMAFFGGRFLLTLELDKVRTYQYLQMPASPEKQKTHDEIRSSLDRLDEVAGIRTYLPLKEVEARFAIGSGAEEEMKEIQTLNKLMSDNPPSPKEYYWYALETLLAQGYEDTNQTSLAMGIMKNVSQQYPHDVPALEQLVRLMLVEQPDQARPEIEALAKLNPDDQYLTLYRIELLMSDPVKNHDAIAKFYTELTENSVRMMSVKARVALRIQDYNEATRLLKMAVARDPGQVEDWVMLARLQFMLDKKDDALATANMGLAANPKDPQLRLLIPKINGESHKVIDDLQAEMAKENPDKSQGEMVLAGLAHQRGDAAEEQSHLEAAVKAAPSSTRIQDTLFNFYLEQKKFDLAANCIPALAKMDADRAGGELYRLALSEAKGDNSTAESIARKLTQDKPEFARSWLAMGDVLQNEQRYQEAIPQYNNCLQRESSLVEGYVGLARCFYGLHQYEDAMHIIEQGLARLPDNPTLEDMKMAHEVTYGQPEDAVRDIRQELSIHRNQPKLYAELTDATLRYAQLLRDKYHQPADAVKQAAALIPVLQEPLTTYPDEPELYLAMSQSQMAANQPNDAIKTLEAWSQRPNWKMSPEPYLAMSQVYNDCNQPDKAEDEMHTAMARSGYRVDLQLRMASLLAIHKKYDDALALLHSVNTDKPEVRERIVQILLLAGRFDQAQAELKSDLEGNPPDAAHLQATWALACYERNMFPEAVEHSTAALAITPNDPTSLFCRARAHLRMRPPQADVALPDLQRVRESSPNNIDVKLTLADTYLMLNRSEDAITELESGVRALPNNKPLLMKLVDLYVNGPHPRLTAALAALQKVDGTDPFNKDADVFQNESVIYAKLGDNNNALAKIEAARQIAPDNEGILRTEIQLLVDVQNYQGVFDRYAALNDKMKASSWALWNLALAEKRTNNPQALADFQRGMVAAEKEDLPVVLDGLAQTVAKEFSYNDAINSLQPISDNYPSAKISLARLYQTQGNDTAAMESVDVVMSKLSSMNVRDQMNALGSAALVYQLAKPVALTDKAYNAYMAWLKLDPANVEALNNLACLLADSYNPPRAEEGLKFANQAVSEMSQLGRTEPRMLDTKAWLLILNGQPEEGIDILNKIMEDFEPFPDEYVHIAEGYLRKQLPDPVQAETQAKLGLQLVNRRNAGADDANVRAKLQDLINRSEEKRQSGQQAQVP